MLIEEVTGIGCQLCPNGARSLKSLIEQNSNKAYLVALHSGSFSEPYNESTYDFRTEDANQIVASLGLPSGYPKAAINRIPNSNNEYFLYAQSWSNRISNGVTTSTPLNISINNIYNEYNNELEVIVKTAFTEGVIDNLQLFIYFNEYNIIDFQVDSKVASGCDNGYVFDYEPNHVFRDCITNVLGDPLNFGEKKAGNVLQKRIILNPIIEGTNKWNLDNCHIIAFVSKTGTSREVIHAQEVKLK